MELTQEWIALWKKNEDKLASPVDLNTYFEQPELEGKQLDRMTIGLCSVPTGYLLVRDPLCYLDDREELPYYQKVPQGMYETEVSVIKPDEEEPCARYAAVRICFTKEPAVRFGEALIGIEELEGLEEDEYFGFNVDAGLGCICDEEVHKAFCDFSEQWHRDHEDGNLYDDYFAELFAVNYQEHPEYQRSDGDWLNWVIPGTDYHLPIFQTGFGDGAYPVYWGYDASGEICQMVIQLIDISLAYGEEENI